MLANAFSEAVSLIGSGNEDLFEILALSVSVSLTALAISLLVALPMGTVLAISRFPGKRAIVTCLNAFMAMPPVVVGLLVYLLLSRSGPLGVLGLLYTPSAMVIAQVLLITPIIASLAHQTMEDLHLEYAELFHSLKISKLRAVPVYLWDARYSLVTAVLAGFGRAVSEVGAVIIVGGNIDHLTRVMTTAIALETAKGELAMALALGMILVSLALLVNAAVMVVRSYAQRHAYV